MNNHQFQELLWQKGSELYRDMPWRQDTRPYYVLVSELMLQQTQVERVIPKFSDFIMAFPDEQTLAVAPLADVLRLWNGLGYNRRAKFLHDSAKKIVALGEFPATELGLTALSGVGKNTAGAIMAYAYNQPAYFIETNVRTVYIHHFFEHRDTVADAEIMQKLHETLDLASPQSFYWALMDYGSWLKKQGVGKITRSAHYKKQSALKGSVREVRGQIIRELANGTMSLAWLQQKLPVDERFEPALQGLLRDGLISKQSDEFYLTK